jgi:hypothetical protein
MDDQVGLAYTSYAELIAKALKGRSVNATAKDWNVQQRTLDRYVKVEMLPDFRTVIKIVEETAVTYEEVIAALAIEETKRKNHSHAKVVSNSVVPERGVEPPTSSLRMNCSTN